MNFRRAENDNILFLSVVSGNNIMYKVFLPDVLIQEQPMPWNPDLYHKFQEERFAPFNNLAELITVKQGMEVIDLGCGTGELTKLLSEKLPSSRILGIDSSPEMLERANIKSAPGLSFELRSITDIEGEWDLIFSNAAIQWVPEHRELIPKLFSHILPGGQLAVQLPSNHSHPTQNMILETGMEEPYRKALNGWSRSYSVLTIREYSELLFESSGEDIVVFERVYPHVLRDSYAILDWLSGTAILPYLKRLPAELREPFLGVLGDKLKKAYPGSPVFYPFNRIFFSAHKPK
jgi:trans-aconitate 2-methyltransferase